MELLTFRIDGEEIPIETIWVHFQGGESPNARPFCLTVPLEHVKCLFNRHGNCPSGTSLDTYWTALVSELGTFVVGGLIKDIRKLLQKEQGAFQWVIATVDEVKDTGEAMVLRGKVVPFVR